jgi:hypothetical protein
MALQLGIVLARGIKCAACLGELDNRLVATALSSYQKGDD